ncbi:TetR/AcrR family transcriptional regulator [Streptomyces sp. NPDC048604]|uniref:TetR/AcrR family transcriptional regulator n=1 Tax=Streptomyces sp. NPDC048604 TaxID=3365578 RepID=UPI0037109CE0
MDSPDPAGRRPAREGAGRPATVQRRRLEREKAILDAAEKLLAEQGYEAATLKGIGERAGIPTASVYHYYADRHEVDAELVRRHLRALDELVETALNDPGVDTLQDVIDAVVEPQLAYHRRHQSFVVLWYAGAGPALTELARAHRTAQAEQLWRLLLTRELVLPDTPLHAVEVAFEAGDRLFDVAFRRSPGGDATTIREARRLVTAYLETYATQ